MGGVSVLEYPSPQEALDNEQHVYFPPGKYYGPFLVRSFHTVEGAGPGSVDEPDAGGTVLVSNDGASVIARKESSPPTVSNIILRDFAVIHEGTGAPAIDLPGLRSSTLEQLAVLSVDENALEIRQPKVNGMSQATWLNRFEGCSFQATQKHSILFEGTDSVFQGCLFFWWGRKNRLGCPRQGGRYSLRRLQEQSLGRWSSGAGAPDGGTRLQIRLGLRLHL